MLLGVVANPEVWVPIQDIWASITFGVEILYSLYFSVHHGNSAALRACPTPIEAVLGEKTAKNSDRTWGFATHFFPRLSNKILFFFRVLRKLPQRGATTVALTKSPPQTGHIANARRRAAYGQDLFFVNS